MAAYPDVPPGLNPVAPPGLHPAQVATFVYPSVANTALSMFSCGLLDGNGEDLLPGEALAATGRRWTLVVLRVWGFGAGR